MLLLVYIILAILINSLLQLTIQCGLLYTLPMSINRSVKLYSIYSILCMLLQEHICGEGKITQV